MIVRKDLSETKQPRHLQFVRLVASYHVDFEEFWYAEYHRNNDDRDNVVNDSTPRVHPLGGVMILDGLGYCQTSK